MPDATEVVGAFVFFTFFMWFDLQGMRADPVAPRS
jgi:hypothetical protein